MTGAYSGAQGPGVGPIFDNFEFLVYSRYATTLVIGDVVMLDHLAADGGGYSATAINTTNPNAAYGRQIMGVDGGTGDANAATWPWGNALLPTTAGIGALIAGAGAGTGGSGGAPLAVVTNLMGGGGVNNSIIRVCGRGLVDVNTVASAAVVFGDGLFAAAAVTLTPTLTAGVRVVGKALSGRTNGATIQKVFCYFDGFDLFGKTPNA